MDIHVGKRAVPNASLCQWTHHHEDVDLRCDDPACLDHPGPDVRTFPAVAVTAQLDGEQTPA